MRRSFRITTCAAISVLAGLALFAAGAVPAAPSFAGKQITMIIGYKPGGGTDAVGRLLGEYLAKYLPGRPDIIYRNMPGGGGITAMNYFARQVEPDGLTITVGSSTQPDPLRWRSQTSHYDPTKFEIIGGILRGATVLVMNKEAEERISDKSKPPVIMGALDGSRSGMQAMMWGIEYLDWNAKWVTGYPGTAELALALQRGEIDVTSTANAFLILELVRSGKFTPLAQSGTPSEGKLVPRPEPELADAPLIPELVRPKLKSEREKLAFDYWEGINTLDKWMALPPDTPDEIVKVYRTAFRQAVKDSAFIERGRKLISEDFAPVMPEDQERLIRQVALTPEEALDYIDELKKKQGLPVSKR
jgi:tripartite-type tricarboxylate transporter receptor subunit TctC